MTDWVSQITPDRNKPLGLLKSIVRPILDLDSQLELLHGYQNGKVFTNEVMNSILTRCQGMIRSEATFTCQTIAETFKKGFEVDIPFIVAMFL